ncbi:hypothetical protein CERSUDRAFT_115979 [Gelatoporia subvermispora B]|uniref:WSC domain-containing protein n=1 Tax=Ceriporiopsis subvermispora (strain B) TaxID=914234 RepID=M2RBA4_CERS8|nr:hypothetical protein CERSUDRAFT_115979 [Gelatoporia subvermispora B]
MGSLLSPLAVLALSLSPLTQASHINVGSHLHRRAASVPDLPANWTFFGCFTDNPGARTLTGPTFTNTTSMTVESCVDFCNDQSFIFAGVEFAQECYCGNAMDNGGTNTSLTDCSTACTGNADELCGAGDRLDVYWSGVQPAPPPETVAAVGLWDSLGCFNDSTGARTFPVQLTLDNTSVETCTDGCFNAGYPLAGMEFAAQCFCGLTFENGAVPIDLSSCNMQCSGNSSEFCGGPNALNVYNFTGTLPHGPEPPDNGGGGGGQDSSPVFPVTSGLPEPWRYAGCFVDGANGRILPNEFDSDNTTVESCISTCSSGGFGLAGLEFSTQCFCGDALVNGATNATDSDCDMGCGGDATEACGGPNRISLYANSTTITSFPVPVVLNTSLPGQWKYQGCFQEGADGARVFPYENIWTDNMTIEACLNQCAAFGFPAAGAEFAEQCFCGDPSDVTSTSQGQTTESSCSSACSGDPVHLCGGADTLNVYFWDGDIDVWHTPEVTGAYEFLIGGVVVPLLTTLGINNKVAFLEKWGTSEFDNSTGAYELDLSLTNNFDLAWRTMHVQTDVFCSGALVLPDRAARQLNVGGWSLTSTFGVRLYTPDGTPGVNGTNDWEENPNELQLQRGRWYPSALVLSNGTVLVVGGEVGSNGAPEPTLEILPTPAGGPTYKFLDYLNRTDPNNLYPFLHVMPSGRIFIGYYNEARLLDPTSLDTDVVLPNMPGSVNDFLAGRTYPMEGTAVLLPMKAPYTEPATLLVCGGSPGAAAEALDNCISIQPEVENPQWTIERMPSKRVMTCIVTLPDGTYLIVNGAQIGVAGFGLGEDPNLGALLYDPVQPVHQRISILNTTIVARLYHSESTLLPDGRVLITGSDPQTPGLPEEFRVEVYIPPYLSTGKTQPTFDITEHDWDYNGQYEITVQLFEGTTDTMNISLIAATSSTHGNNMGARVLFPEFSCSGTTCTITAPPNSFISPPGWHQLWVLDGPTPSHSHWVRIGGDPAELGNWPDFPDFTRPGVGPISSNITTL